VITIAATLPPPAPLPATDLVSTQGDDLAVTVTVSYADVSMANCQNWHG